jgi:hypothetical protein
LFVLLRLLSLFMPPMGFGVLVWVGVVRAWARVFIRCNSCVWSIATRGEPRLFARLFFKAGASGWLPGSRGVVSLLPLWLVMACLSWLKLVFRRWVVFYTCLVTLASSSLGFMFFRPYELGITVVKPPSPAPTRFPHSFPLTGSVVACGSCGVPRRF